GLRAAHRAAGGRAAGRPRRAPARRRRLTAAARLNMRRGVKPWPTMVRGAALGWLVVHFALTVAYVMPLNPVTAAVQPLLRATIGTYFPQGWAFFAPDPGWSVPVLLARPLSPAE